MAALGVVLAGALLAAGWWLSGRTGGRDGGDRRASAPEAVPVAVADIEIGPIALERTFSGELEAPASFVVAPKVGGRVVRMLAAIADSVERGQTVAELDNDEYVQTVAQARADLEVARANHSEAESALATATREFDRTASLLKRGIASDSEFDAARQAQIARQAQLKVAVAQVHKAEAALQTANIRMGYTRVTADWSGGSDRRVVAERYVDEGQTVAANAPLLRIVELNPMVGIIHVTERDYARLEPGQPVLLTTDAYPGARFAGRIDRIAPVFTQSTRQARVEIRIDNPRHLLKPGMFITAGVVLERLPDATIVPRQALTERGDRTGIFVVDADGGSVHWRPVQVGIVQGERAQVTGEALTGRVVVLGQQLVDDGSPITIPAPEASVTGNDGGADR